VLTPIAVETLGMASARANAAVFDAIWWVLDSGMDFDVLLS
jgi:hypothetical protein